MQVLFEDISTRLFSPQLWRGFAPPTAFGPDGGCATGASGNPAFGFFDDFLSFQASTLEGPYLMLETGGDGGITIEQDNDVAGVKGLLKITFDAGTAEDEGVLQWGRGLCAPFKLADKDLAFECRMAVSAITASKWSAGVGLGEVGMGATDCFFADSSGALADKNFCGFNKLYAETSAWDGAYKADTKTYQNGATKTKLDTLATFEAYADVDSYHKLGFRYRAHPKTVEWYVDGVMPGGLITPARLTASEVDAATFPDDVFMAPIIGAKSTAGSAAYVIYLDWWACAQYE